VSTFSVRYFSRFLGIFSVLVVLLVLVACSDSGGPGKNFVGTWVSEPNDQFQEKIFCKISHYKKTNYILVFSTSSGSSAYHDLPIEFITKVSMSSILVQEILNENDDGFINDGFIASYDNKNGLKGSKSGLTLATFDPANNQIEILGVKFSKK
jgi:hypothetical protein